MNAKEYLERSDSFWYLPKEDFELIHELMEEYAKLKLDEHNKESEA